MDNNVIEILRMIDLKASAFISIVVISVVLLVILCKKMNQGFGPQNLKTLGLITIAIFSALLGFLNDSSLQAAFGIFGAIAGYLFGSSSDESGSASSSKGNYNQIAGRDLINNIEKQITELRHEIQQSGKNSFHIRVLYKEVWKTKAERNIQDYVRKQIEFMMKQGWNIVGITSDLNGADCITLLFSKNDGNANIISSTDKE